MGYDNSGSIGNNSRKTSDKHPDLSGKATINGVEYWISGWHKNTGGDDWISLAFKKKDAQQPSSTPRPAAPKTPARTGARFPGDMDDDLPF